MFYVADLYLQSHLPTLFEVVPMGYRGIIGGGGGGGGGIWAVRKL